MKKNLKLSPLIFVYIVFHRGQDGEHSHKKSPRKSADPGVIYNIPEKILSNYLAAYIYRFSLQLISCKSNDDAMLYIYTQNSMSVNCPFFRVSVGGLQKEGALLVISASRLAQTEPILQLYDLKGKT